MNKLNTLGLSVALVFATGSAAAHKAHSGKGHAVVAGHHVNTTHHRAVAHASTTAPSGFYAGMGAGESSISFTDDPESYEDANIRAFMGYQLNQYFAVEAGFGSHPFDNLLGAADLTGMDVSVLAKLPVTSRFSAYGRVGYWDWDVSVPYYGTYYDLFGGTDMLYGIGLEYKLSPNLAFRLDATRYELSNADDESEIDTVTANVAYNF